MRRLTKKLSIVIICITTATILGQVNSVENATYAATVSEGTQFTVNNQIYNFKITTGEKLINVQEGQNVYEAYVSNNEHKVYMQFNCEDGTNFKDFIVTGSDNTIVGNISEEEPVLTIKDLKEGLNIIKIRNREDNSDLYKFYINYKNVQINGLNNRVNTGDEFKLDAIIDGHICKNVKWTSVGINSVIISEDGQLTAVNNGIAYIIATIYDNDGQNIIGSVNLKFNVSGEPKLGWIKNDGKWYYIDESTKCFKIGWFFANGKWYNFNNYGLMQTGWIKDQGKWYLINENGAMKTECWVKDHGNWYYLNSDGTMQTTSKYIDGKFYDFTKNGTLTEDNMH